MSGPLAQLQMRGLPTRDAREHSLPWLLETAEESARRLRREQANALTFATLAAAAGAGSQEAAEEVDRLREELIPVEENEDLAHLLDENAKTDWNTLAGFGASPPGQRPPLVVGRVHGPATQETPEA